MSDNGTRNSAKILYAVDDPVRQARAARIIRAALARRAAAEADSSPGQDGGHGAE